MTEHRTASTGETSFFLQQPALVAAITTLLIGGGFIYAVYASTTGHHGPAAHAPSATGKAANPGAPSASASPQPAKPR
jgi:hypothetical protein